VVPTQPSESPVDPPTSGPWLDPPCPKPNLMTVIFLQLVSFLPHDRWKAPQPTDPIFPDHHTYLFFFLIQETIGHASCLSYPFLTKVLPMSFVLMFCPPLIPLALPLFLLIRSLRFFVCFISCHSFSSPLGPFLFCVLGSLPLSAVREGFHFDIK